MQLTISAPTRECLRARVGQFVQVTGTFDRVGTRTIGPRGHDTILLRDLRDAESGELLCDHAWFNRGKVWQRAGVSLGDTVRLEARVIEYRAGYWGPNIVRRVEAPARQDYKLTAPSWIQVIGRRNHGVGAAA